MRGKLIILGVLALAVLTSTTIYAKVIPVKQGDSQLNLTENSYSSLSFELSITEFEARTLKTQQGLFTEVILDGSQYSLDIGYPRLPWINRLIEVPLGCELNVEILFSAYQDFNLTQQGYPGQVFPYQGPLVKSDLKHPFQYNNQAYQYQGFISQEMVTVEYVGEMRGVNIARIRISPFMYDPSTNTLRVFHTLNARVSFDQGDIEATLQNKTKYHSPYFESAHRLLWNYKPLPVSSTGTEDVITQYPVKYVIVADSMFSQALQPFISWKRRKGFKVVEAYMQNPSVGSTNISIKTYLQGLYNSATAGNPAPSFILFVGDVAQLPAFNVPGHVTDRNYCEYTNDALPEVYYGRFSASNIQQLQVQINKTLEYEQYLMQDPTFLNNVVLVAGADGTFGPTHANGQINYGANNYFNTAHGLNTDAFLYPASSSNASLIRQKIGNGVAFANYTAHGSSSGWGDPAFSTGQVSAMNNPGRYPLMVGNACLTSQFDQPECFGEALLRADGKGAIGYIGASNNTFWDEDFYWAVGLGTISSNPTFSGTSAGMYDLWVHDHGENFQSWFFTQAQMMFAGNLAVTQSASSVNYYWEIYHVLGDPSLMPYLGVPEPMQVTYTPLIPLGLTQFTVSAVPYAYVALTRNDTLFGAVIADSNGIAAMSIHPFTSAGIAEVVVTAQNYQPFIGTALAASPIGPFLAIDGFTIDDAAGNANGLADYGESVIIDVDVNNLTSFNATTVNFHLSTSDTSKISLLDTTYSMAVVLGLTKTSTSGAFALKVKDFIPDGYNVPFVVTMDDNNGNLWTSTFTLTLNAPKLRILDLVIDDSNGGNGNGRLDAGEVIDIKVVAANLGHANTGNTSLSFYSSDYRIVLASNHLNVTALNAGDTLVAVVSATVYSLAPHGTVVTFSTEITSGLYTDQALINRMVGRIDDDFETGNLSKFNWVGGGNQGWVIDPSESYQGAFCARSATIADQQNSSLIINMNVICDDSIWFQRRVSSENYYDFLEFYIDGVMQQQWSGSVSWGLVGFPVMAGQREFRWDYVKDYYLAAGQDRAWIDNVVFPPNDLWAGTDNPIDDKQLIELFPNPSTGQFSIRLEAHEGSPVKCTVFDAVGRLVLSQEFNAVITGTTSLNVDLSSVGQGIYYVALNNGQTTQTLKVVVARNQ